MDNDDDGDFISIPCDDEDEAGSEEVDPHQVLILDKASERDNHQDREEKEEEEAEGEEPCAGPHGEDMEAEADMGGEDEEEEEEEGTVVNLAGASTSVKKRKKKKKKKKAKGQVRGHLRMMHFFCILIYRFKL